MSVLLKAIFIGCGSRGCIFIIHNSGVFFMCCDGSISTQLSNRKGYKTDPRINFDSIRKTEKNKINLDFDKMFTNYNT
jgi:hypothetical protein